MRFHGKFVIVKLRSPDVLEEVPQGLLAKWICPNCFEPLTIEAFGWRLMPNKEETALELHKQSYCQGCRRGGLPTHLDPDQLDLFTGDEN